MRRKEANHSTGWGGSLYSVRWYSSPRQRGSQKVSWNRNGCDRARAIDSRVAAPRSVLGGGAETQPDGQLGMESRPGYQVLVGGMLPCSEFRFTGWFAPIRRLFTAASSRRPTRLQGTNPDGYSREGRVGGGLPHRASRWPHQGHSRLRSSCSEHVRPSH